MAKMFIKADLKGFYFFSFEIELLKQIGLDLTDCMEVIIDHGFVKVKIIKNPTPIEATKENVLLLEELKYKMNAINIIEKVKK